MSNSEEVLPRIQTSNHEVTEVKVVFDPIAEAHKMHAQVGEQLQDLGNTIDDFDLRNKLENQFVDAIADAVVGSGLARSWGEVHARIRGAERAEWAMQEIQHINSKLHSGFEAEEVIDINRLSNLIGILDLGRSDIFNNQRRGKINSKYYPTDIVDAISITSGLEAFKLKENISIGNKVVDLGGGDGVWSMAFSESGYDVTMLEKDENLIEEYLENRRQLNQVGTPLRDIKVIRDEFKLDSTQNLPETNNALNEADIFVSYPYPSEIKDRLQLFRQHAKDGAILIMYGGALEGIVLDLKTLDSLGLEVVSKEIKTELQNQTAEYKWVRGFPAPGGGAGWLAIRKKI